MPEKRDSVTKVSSKLLDMLNEAIARELQVSIQYMWQHVQWGGVKGFAVQSEFKSIAMQEMKHAEAIAERLYYLGGIPSTRPTPINVGNTIKERLEQDIKDEAGAITLYKQIIEVANQDKDSTTAFLFQDILKAEEAHHDTFTTMLEDL